MRKILLIVSLLSVIGLMVGCSKTEYVPPDNADWITPAEVEIKNFHFGAEVDGVIKIHNGDTITTRLEKWNVVTEKEETTATIGLKSPLVSLQDIQVTSDNPSESLIVKWYDSPTKQIGISGFLPDTERMITLKYQANRQYKVVCRSPDNAKEGYVVAPNWVIGNQVTIGEPTPILKAKETREILITVILPDSISEKLPQKWEFWITVMDANSSMIATEMAQRWLISMR